MCTEKRTNGTEATDDVRMHADAEKSGGSRKIRFVPSIAGSCATSPRRADRAQVKYMRLSLLTNEDVVCPMPQMDHS